MIKPEVEQRLINFVSEFRDDPTGFAQYMYPWGKGELADSLGPRVWQSEINDIIKAHLQNPATRFQPLLIAIASGHGIGKSAEISMVLNWGMSTCSDCMCVVTANTEGQLRSKTWPEVCRWFRRAHNSHWFKPTATAIYSTADGHERTWRADAIPWSENNTEAFAGLHNKGKRIILVFDEGSAISDKVYEVAEGALTDENTEIIWIVFGNPTRNSGRFRELFGKHKHRWVTKQIDSRTVEGTNKVLIKEWVDAYGEDSDFVRVRVRGEFPRAGTMQFIPSDLVEAARKRPAEAKLYDPLVMGVDVARFGEDATVICLRRGRDAKSVPWVKLRGADTMQVAARVMELAGEYRPDAIFIDGGGVGGGVIDRLNMFKFPVVEVNFGGGADRGQQVGEGMVRYANKRAEMWGNMREWLKGGMIPDEAGLADELVGVEYGYVMRDGVDAILLEKKSDMKKRGLASPDEADALCLVKNTIISTPNGGVPIENLKVGDVVRTPFGDTMIVKTWESLTEKLTKVNFSDGSQLCGKGEHKIFTWGSGQKRLDALSLTDVVSVIDGDKKIWRMISLFTMGLNIQFKPLVDIIRATRGGNVTVRAFFIAIFGLIISDLYQRVMLFITKMVIGEITKFQILIQWMAPSTVECTQQKCAEVEYCNRRAPLLLKEPLRGTLLRREMNGTARTAKKHGKTESLFRQFVRYVLKNMRHIFYLEPIIVQQPVLKKSDSEHISLTGEHVLSAARNLWRIATGQRPVAPVSVQTENVPPTLVYNLTLEKHNAYYANGVLVYNCLTFAYPVMPSDHSAALMGKTNHHQVEYNPLSREHIAETSGTGYNPFKR